MSTTETKFCTRCGASLTQGAAFCASCGASVTSAPPMPQPQSVPQQQAPPHSDRDYWREQRRAWREQRRSARRANRHTGALMWGIIIIWLGIALYLGEANVITGSRWWAYFLSGVGIILISAGLLRWASHEALSYPPLGYLIGGSFLLIIGVATVIEVTFFGPAVLIVIGIAILLSAVMAAERRAQPPTQETQPSPPS